MLERFSPTTIVGFLVEWENSNNDLQNNAKSEPPLSL